MDKVVVATVQQRMRLHDNVEACRADVGRFLRMARAKQASLVVFPELIGLLAAGPLLEGMRGGLLRQAEQARRPRASLWARAKGRVAESTAGVLKVDFQQALNKLLAEGTEALWEAYVDLFARAAREHRQTIVAGSGYFRDPQRGAVVNRAVVFDPDGEIIGRQDKVVLSAGEGRLARAGNGWSPIDTEVGRIGVLLGADVLYPEAARALAYEGVTILVGLGASPGMDLYRKMRVALNARVQENQIYGLISFLIGHNPLGTKSGAEYAGQSAILAPADFTPQGSGIMVQLGTSSSEGVITAEWDFEALEELWEDSATPLRRNMPMGAFQALSDVYAERHSLHDAWQAQAAVAEAELLPAEVIPVEELHEVAVAPAELAPEAEPPIAEEPEWPEEEPEAEVDALAFAEEWPEEEEAAKFGVSAEELEEFADSSVEEPSAGEELAETSAEDRMSDAVVEELLTEEEERQRSTRAEGPAAEQGEEARGGQESDDSR